MARGWVRMGACTREEWGLVDEDNSMRLTRLSPPGGMGALDSFPTPQNLSSPSLPSLSRDDGPSGLLGAILCVVGGPAQ